jgi:hypothetical protein
MSNSDIPVKQIVVLTPAVYQQFEASLPQPVVGERTTAEQAGFLLGIQFVLKALRTNLVIKQ